MQGGNVTNSKGKSSEIWKQRHVCVNKERQQVRLQENRVNDRKEMAVELLWIVGWT